jgi:hypothetical protein
MDLDDRNVLEVADVGDAYFDRAHRPVSCSREDQPVLRA